MMADSLVKPRFSYKDLAGAMGLESKPLQNVVWPIHPSYAVTILRWVSRMKRRDRKRWRRYQHQKRKQ